MSGTARIEAGLSGNPVDPSDPKDVGYFTNRILVPLLRQTRATLNRLVGVTKLSASNVTLDGSEGLVAVDASSAPVIVALPQPTALFHPLVIAKSDSTGNSVTISAPPGVTINGASSVVLSSQWASVALVADDTRFYSNSGAQTAIPVAILEVPFGTTNPTTNDVSMTVPASPTGNGRFVLETFEVWSDGIGASDAGTVTLTMGASSGSNEYMLAQAITSATPSGIQGGLALASTGTSMLINNGYRAQLAAGAAIHLTAVTSVGTVSAGKKARAYIYGTFQT